MPIMLNLGIHISNKIIRIRIKLSRSASKLGFVSKLSGSVYTLFWIRIIIIRIQIKFTGSES